MKPNTRENVAKFFYDCGKITFTILVVGVIARRPFILTDALWGVIFTLILFITGIIINQIKVTEEF